MNSIYVKQLILNGIKLKQVSKVKQAIKLIDSRILSYDQNIQYWMLFGEGYIARREYQFSLAIQRFENLIALHVKLEDELYGRVLNALGITYDLISRWDKALQCYETALFFQRLQKNSFQEGILLQNIAFIYSQCNLWNQAIQYARDSISILSTKPHDQLWQINLARAYNTLGTTYFFCGQFEKAKKTYLYSLDIKKTVGM